ncbi:hypothetical protein KCP74_15880 [Salmonella enterica subsp. enterica]|nr:hypothetical protein KCP74_15880 [Salmonella enterica subsp. enterica]
MFYTGVNDRRRNDDEVNDRVTVKTDGGYPRRPGDIWQWKNLSEAQCAGFRWRLPLGIWFNQ